MKALNHEDATRSVRRPHNRRDQTHVAICWGEAGRTDYAAIGRLARTGEDLALNVIQHDPNLQAGGSRACPVPEKRKTGYTGHLRRPALLDEFWDRAVQFADLVITPTRPFRSADDLRGGQESCRWRSTRRQMRRRTCSAEGDVSGALKRSMRLLSEAQVAEDRRGAGGSEGRAQAGLAGANACSGVCEL